MVEKKINVNGDLSKYLKERLLLEEKITTKEITIENVY